MKKLLCIFFFMAAITLLVSVILLGLAAVWSAVNSAFFLTVMSTAVAAFAGAYGAQFLDERIARRRELLTEIRGTNVAICLTFSIMNTYVDIKKQWVHDLVSQYEKQYQSRNDSSSDKLQWRFKRFSTPPVLVDKLQAVFTDRISPDRNALLLLTPLVQSIHVFADTVFQRNTWIEEFRKDSDELSYEHKESLYFGIQLLGFTDRRYPDFMDALKNHTNHCIAFSILIIESLQQYGNRLAAEIGCDAPKIVTVDLTEPKGWLPDVNEPPYTDWPRNQSQNEAETKAKLQTCNQPLHRFWNWIKKILCI